MSTDIMILMGNSRFPRHNMNVLFIKVILSYIQGAHEDIIYQNFDKLNTWAVHGGALLPKACVVETTKKKIA